MRILLLGKFPPIQGGVSAQTYWAALELLRAGHQLTIVTNAAEVEPNFRVGLTPQDEEHLGSLDEPDRFTLRQVSPLRLHSFIPYTASTESRLFGLACEMVRQYSFDVIVGWYLQPYAVVAAQVARYFGLPFVAIHAGSDLFRLAKHPNLQEAFRQTLAFADRIITFPIDSISNALRALGADPHKFTFLPAAQLPHCFHRRRAGAGSTEARPKASNSQYPRVLSYTKVSEPKGVFDLCSALAMLAGKVGFEFMCVGLGRDAELKRLSSYLANHPQLLASARMLEPVPPWSVPALLADCDLIVSLERDFPIEAHGSLIPREALASGKCLIVSSEMSKKQPFGRSLVNGKTSVIVSDPKNHAELAARLSRVIEDGNLRESIARSGRFLSEAHERTLPPSNSYAVAILTAAELISADHS